MGAPYDMPASVDARPVATTSSRTLFATVVEPYSLSTSVPRIASNAMP